MGTFFEKLQRYTQLLDSGSVPTYLRSHPDVNIDLLYRRTAEREDAFDAGLAVDIPLFDAKEGRLREARAELEVAGVAEVLGVGHEHVAEVDAQGHARPEVDLHAQAPVGREVGVAAHGHAVVAAGEVCFQAAPHPPQQRDFRHAGFGRLHRRFW